MSSISLVPGNNSLLIDKNTSLFSRYILILIPNSIYFIIISFVFKHNII